MTASHIDLIASETPDSVLGEMPEPRDLVMAMETMNQKGNHPWIGIRAYGLDGEVKNFLWYRNIPKASGQDLAGMSATWLLGGDVEIAFGPSI